MAADGLINVRVVSVGDRPRAAWAEGTRVNLPVSVIERMGWHISASRDLTVTGGSQSVANRDDAAALRERHAFTPNAPTSSRLPVNYQRVPSPVRSLIASAIGRWKRQRSAQWAAFPSWPLDLSADFVADLDEPTPRSALPTPVVLTHDIDSPEGLTNVVSLFLSIEEAAGARSTSYVVPCGWPIDEGLMGELTARGHDVGVHGYDHANRTPFAAPDERRARLDRARPFISRWKATGYRAPSLLRTRALIADLRGRYTYDSSIPTSGGPFPVPNNGCSSARPFTIEGMLELPLTMPRDGSLRFLGHSPDEIALMWIECAESIARSGGIVVLLTHCEARFSGTPSMLGAYRRFIDYVRERSSRFVFSTPLQVIRAFC